ncbi:hypothetical protein ACFLZB_01155 [Nanoarchaeota archaeon]
MDEEIKIEKVADEEEQKKTNHIRNFLIIAGIIVAIFILILSLKFIIPSTPEVLTLDDLHRLNADNKLDETQGIIYNGYSFVKVETLWYTRVSSVDAIYEIPLHYTPQDLEDVTVSGSLNHSSDTNEVYFTFNPHEPGEKMKYITLSISEVAQSMAKAMKKKPVPACDQYAPDLCGNNTEVITCNNTKKPVIYFKYEPGPAIELNDNCAVIKGEEDDLVKAAERLILHQLGIMS